VLLYLTHDPVCAASMRLHTGFECVLLSSSMRIVAFSRISPGEYIQAGRRGSRRLGDIAELPGLAVSAGGCCSTCHMILCVLLAWHSHTGVEFILFDSSMRIVSI
jgi:hypothetical protein